MCKDRFTLQINGAEMLKAFRLSSLLSALLRGGLKVTIIEFYDKNAIENIAGAIMCRPERVILVGDRADNMARRSVSYRKVLLKNGISTEFSYTVIGKTCLKEVVERLGELAEKYGDCVFDLTGGDELYLVAVGIVMERYKDRVRCHRFNFNKDKIVDCDSDGNVAQTMSFNVSVSDNVAVYGGEVASGSDDKKHSFDLVFDDELTLDGERLWEICKINPGIWNTQVGIIGNICNAFCGDDSLDVSFDPEHARVKLGDGKGWDRIKNWFLEKLEREGLITSVYIAADRVSFSFKNEKIKRCLTVAGQVLEVYIATKLRKIVDEEGLPLYNDVRVGVVINWDDFEESSVVNEIDVFAMKGAIPIFISCKNGFVEVDELYKLNTVAERFGGKYARKVLVSSNLLDTDGKQKYLAARMQDLNIVHINDLANIPEEELINTLSVLWKER